MRSIFSFAWGWFKKWWALMSCAAFTILSVCEVYALHPNEFVIHGTEGLAVLFGFIGAYQLWKEERDRAMRAERLLEASPISARDWDRMAEEMLNLCQFLDVVCEWKNKEDRTWKVEGSDLSESCKAWLAKAGKMLAESPLVKLEVPSAVLEEPDHFTRWCLYLESRGFLRPSLQGVTTFSNGHITEYFTARVDEVWVVSGRLFKEFAGKEYKPGVDSK